MYDMDHYKVIYNWVQLIPSWCQWIRACIPSTVETKWTDTTQRGLGLSTFAIHIDLGISHKKVGVKNWKQSFRELMPTHNLYQHPATRNDSISAKALHVFANMR